MKEFTLTLGACRNWREYGSGRYELHSDIRGNREKVHVPAIHKGVRCPDPILEGLKAEAAQWQAAAARSAPEGAESRMLKISDVTDAGDDPPAAVPPAAALVQAITLGFERLESLMTAKGR